MVTVRLSRMPVLWKDVDKGVKDVSVFEPELPDAVRSFRKLGPFFEERRGKPTFQQLKGAPAARAFMEDEEGNFSCVLCSRVESPTDERLGGNVRREVRFYYGDCDVPCAISRWKEGEGMSFIMLH